MYISILIFCGGFWFVVRILEENKYQNLFSRQQRNLFLFFFLFLEVIMFMKMSQNSFLLWIFVCLLLYFFKKAPLFVEKYYIRNLHQLILMFIDEVVLQMQSGKSLRSSLLSVIKKQQGWFRDQLLEMHNQILSVDRVSVVSIAQIHALKIELIEIDQQNNKCIENLKIYRRFLKMKEDFRRKAYQASAQTTAQMLITSLIYLGLLFFVITQFGFLKNIKIISISFVLMAFSMGLTLYIRKSFKWKL